MGQFLCSGMSRTVLLWRHSTDWNNDAMDVQMEGILCGDLLDGGAADGKSKPNKKRPPKGKQTKDKGDSFTKVKEKVASKMKTTTTTKTKKGGGGKNSKQEDDDE